VIAIATSAHAIYAASEEERLSALAADLRERLDRLSALSEEYQQHPDLDSMRRDVDDACGLISQGDYASAGKLLNDAALSVSRQEEELEAKANMIDASSQALSEALRAIDEASKTRFTLIQPDLGPAEEEFEKARALLYSDPAQAATLAARSGRMAREAADRAYAHDQLATTVGIGAGIALLVGGLYWLYKREEE